MDMSFDNHTVFIKCGENSKELLEKILIESIKIIESKINIRLNKNYYIKYNKNNRSNNAYIYFEDKRLYNLIVGYNQNGGKMYKNNVLPSIRSMKKDKKPYNSSKNWIDWIEMEEDYLNECKILFEREYLKRYIELPFSKYNIIVERSYSTYLPEKFKRNCIECDNVPRWVSMKHITNIIYKFVPESDMPMINFKKMQDNSIKLFIIFKEYGNSAQFLLMMIRDIIVYDTVSGRSVNLSFRHSLNEKTKICD